MFRKKAINIFSPFLHPNTHKNAQNKLKLGELRQQKVFFVLKMGKDVILKDVKKATLLTALF